MVNQHYLRSILRIRSKWYLPVRCTILARKRNHIGETEEGLKNICEESDQFERKKTGHKDCLIIIMIIKLHLYCASYIKDDQRGITKIQISDKKYYSMKIITIIEHAKL